MISITPLRFFDTRLTLEEQLAIAVSNDAMVKLFVMKLPETVNGEAWRAVLAVFSDFFKEPL